MSQPEDTHEDQRIVIAGGGLGGLRMVENLRKRGFAGTITVVSAEDHMPYDRPPLSKELLWGEREPDDLAFGVSDEAGDIEWHLGSSVAHADLDAKTVTLSDGETLSYDGLVGATGVSSRRLPIPGPTGGRVVLRTLDDAATVKAALKAGAHIVSLGAGFIGCEVGRTAVKLGAHVDIVAIDPVPMAMPLGQEVGAELQRRHETAGITFHMGQSITETRGADPDAGDDQAITEVVLSDGTRLPCDLLLETVGSVPNTAWLDGNDLDLTNGVATDAYLRMGGHSGVVAVGDIARFANPGFKAPAMRIEHWQTAIDTAVFASATLLYDLGASDQEPKPVDLLPWFWSDQGDVHLTSYGNLGIADSIDIIDGDLTDDAAVRYLKDGKPVGILVLGMKRKAARYKRQLIKERKALTQARPEPL